MTNSFTDAELAAMTPADRALAEEFDAFEEPGDNDGRFGALPYDEVIIDGKPL